MLAKKLFAYIRNLNRNKALLNKLEQSMNMFKITFSNEKLRYQFLIPLENYLILAESADSIATQAKTETRKQNLKCVVE